MWSVTLPFNPVATPRPSAKRTETGVTTYYTEKYNKYTENVYKYLEDNKLIDDDFYKTLDSDMGVIMEVDFFIKLRKDQKEVKSIMRTYAPDIDNLLKGAMDCVFNKSGIKDSRIVGVIAFKYNTFKNPRTEIRLKKFSEVIESKNMKKRHYSWGITLPFNPVATPRPSVKRTEKGIITYYSKKYMNYKESIKEYIETQEMYNDDFFEVVKAPLGIIAEIDYYCQLPKNQKTIKKLMKISAPDIDNFVKGTLDSVFFHDLPVRDSRIVGLIAFKFNTLENPRTEIKMRGM